MIEEHPAHLVGSVKIGSSGDSARHYQPIGITDIDIGNQHVSNYGLPGRTLNV